MIETGDQTKHLSLRGKERKKKPVQEAESQDERKPREADVTELKGQKHFKKEGVFINLCIVYGYLCAKMVW